MKLFIVSRQHSIKMEIAMCWKICIHCKAKFINSDVNSRGKKTVEIFISLALLLLHENLICQLFLHTTAAFNIEELFWCACSKKYVGIVNNHRKIHKVARFYVFLHAGTKPRIQQCTFQLWLYWFFERWFFVAFALFKNQRKIYIFKIWWQR